VPPIRSIVQVYGCHFLTSSSAVSMVTNVNYGTFSLCLYQSNCINLLQYLDLLCHQQKEWLPVQVIFIIAISPLFILVPFNDHSISAGWAKKTRLFLRSDNFPTTEDRMASNISKVSETCDILLAFLSSVVVTSVRCTFLRNSDILRRKSEVISTKATDVAETSTIK